MDDYQKKLPHMNTFQKTLHDSITEMIFILYKIREIYSGMIEKTGSEKKIDYIDQRVSEYIALCKEIEKRHNWCPLDLVDVCFSTHVRNIMKNCHVIFSPIGILSNDQKKDLRKSKTEFYEYWKNYVKCLRTTGQHIYLCDKKFFM